MTRYPLVVLTAAGIAATLAAACGTDAPPAASPAAVKVTSPVTEASLTTVTLTPEAEQRLGIVTVAIERRALSLTRTVGGEVMAAAGADTIVTAPVAGTLETSGALPAPGSTVTSGQAMFRLIPLSPSDRDGRVDAERAVGEATARQEAAASRLRRAQQLAADGAGSRRAVEESQESLGIANADLKAAQDRLALAERGNATSAGIVINTPHGGVLRALQASTGQTVAAGAPLFEVVRLDTLWVRVPLFSGEAPDVDPRAPARVVPLGAAADAPGVVARPIPAPPSADPGTAAVDLYFALSNPGSRLRPGERVGVRLTRRGQAVSLVAPRAAILHDAYGGTWMYEARSAQTYVRRRVAVSDIVDTFAVLDQGPEAGTRVVTDGAAELFGTEFGVGK